MKTNKEEAYNKIEQLVERFHEHVDEYKRNVYNEHQTRVDYINPFFKALGWDMDNEQGYAEAYREVIHEDKIKVGSSTKAPDYGFTLFGQRKFFVDAKKPAINIKSDIAPAYQVRRYGWSAKVPISIVTDFEEFSIYDCTKKPKPTDKASVSRIKYITYDQYLDEFDFLWDVFAKENLPKGRFDKYVQSDTRRKGTATVDDEFLKSIEQWRTYLATTIALRNKTLNEDEINYAVQKIIDRILFLRMCEDRGVEQYGVLKKAAQKGDIYQNLFALYHMADDKYNSGLFDFKEDKITPLLTVDNKVMKNIIHDLYYPICEYEFSVMPADILGSVYEQFLGKTIRLTKAHHAKIEEKPEVRKAGGVYYTPKYVVDYIVENTVGKLIKGKTPNQVAKIKICDPACGSGSFLIGAYQFLLDWHLKYYTDNPQKKKKDSPLTPDGNLTTAEKKRILLNNIFGVDIDTQAVEVTKLNLLLKALEGETQASISKQLTFFNERVLPNLGDNIKCGNSLIGSDFYDDQLDLFPEQIKKINAFGWKEGFPEIFKYGGFDAVIGNPPYVLGRETFEDRVKEYFASKYMSYGGKFDLYIYFTEKALSLLSNKGRFGFIIPNTILVNENAMKLRKGILEISLETIRLFDYRVFQHAQVETIILIASNINHSKNHRITIESGKTYKLLQEQFKSNSDYRFNVLFDEQTSKIINKIKSNSSRLGDISDICIGIQLGGSGTKKENFIGPQKMDNTWEKVLDGKDINTYSLNWGNVYVHYGDWLHRKRNEKYFLNPKILIRQIGQTPIATYDDNNYYALNTLYCLICESDISLKFFLAIMNCKLGKWFWLKHNSDFKTIFPKIKKSQLEAIPIVNVSRTGKSYNTIIKQVDNLLKLNEQLPTIRLETQRQQIQRTISHTEKKIDELVYELYGLRKEEIEIVENT
jgi:type I restriction-modification system DNA methylase subunit